MNNHTTYWGIRCRRCAEPVAFDTQSYHSFGLGGTHRPGAIRCSQGHIHIYFPRDFGYFSSEIPISEQIMEANYATYQAVNPAPEVLFNQAVSAMSIVAGPGPGASAAAA